MNRNNVSKFPGERNQKSDQKKKHRTPRLKKLKNITSITR